MPNPLTEEQYLLACLAEECTEVIQEVNKALRFGIDHRWPDDNSPSLRERLVKELADVAVIEGILEAEQILPSLNEAHMEAKLLKVATFMVYARELGTLLPEDEPDA